MRTAIIVALNLGITLYVFGQASARGTFTITGKVVDIFNRPIEGVTVQRFQYGKSNSATPHELELRQHTITGPTGTFELRGSRTTVLLLARKQGFAPGWLMVDAEPGIEYQLVLTPYTATISGIVLDETGRPVTNAEVWAIAVGLPDLHIGAGARPNLLFSRPARYCFLTNTGPDGRFCLDGFPTNATVAVAARAPGKIYAQPEQFRNFTNAAVLPYRAGQQGIRIVLGPAGCVEGKIVSKGTTDTAPVKRVFLQANDPGYIGLTGRDPVEPEQDGRFRIADILPGNYVLRVLFDTNAGAGWSAEPVPVTVVKGETNRAVEVVARYGLPVEVTVLNKTDRSPVEGADVVVYSMTERNRAITEKSGKAILWLPAGEYQLIATKDKWVSEEIHLTVDPDATNRIEVELYPPVKLEGIVKDADNRPVPGVEVFVLLATEEIKRTDSFGKFVLELSQPIIERSGGSMILVGRDVGHNLAGTVEFDDETRKLELQLSQGLKITGQVVSGTQPVSNINVGVLIYLEGRFFTDLTTWSNAGCEIEIPALPMGYKYWVWVHAPGHGIKRISVSSATTNLVDLGRIELKRADTILAGEVVDTDGNAVADARVTLSGEDQPAITTQTDKHGRFKFDGVCEGEVQVRANKRELYGSTTASGGDTNVVVRLDTQIQFSPYAGVKRIKGTVTDQGGNPLAGVRLIVVPGGLGEWVKSSSKGTFQVVVQPSTVDSAPMYLFAYDTNRNLAALQEIEDNTTEIKLQLRSSVTVFGTVRDPAGLPVSNATVSVETDVGRWVLAIPGLRVNTDDRGGYSISGLPVGAELLLQFAAKGYGRAKYRFFSSEEETNRVEIEPIILEVADRVVAGRVLDSTEKPVSGVTVELSGEGQPSEVVTTDAEGRFVFPNVCKGSARLFAYHAGGYGSLSVEAGDTNVVIILRTDTSTQDEGQLRTRLIGKPLPELDVVNLPTVAIPGGKALLVCVFDPEQRPSLRYLRLLAERHKLLKAKGLAVVAIQGTKTTPSEFNAWKETNPLPFPVGFVSEMSDKTKWLTAIDSLPWLILADAQGRVVAEGFSVDELETVLSATAK